MTIAISIKVNDGVVLASDSATTIFGRHSTGAVGVVKIYENANKIFNLRKGQPVGAITWGAGSIGHASVSTLAKDFRQMITEGYVDPDTKEDCAVAPGAYTIEQIAQKFKTFIFDKHYAAEFSTWKDEDKPALGFMIVGYSTNQPLAEEWKIDIVNGKCTGPYCVRKQDQVGITWSGEPEALFRLYGGHSPGLAQVLSDVSLSQEKIKEIMELCRTKLAVPMVMPPMPIQDAIDLAVFLVHTTVNFAKFSPGAATVGGPVEIAAITKYEGFKWVQRKHYFEQSLNPREEGVT